MSKNSPPVYTVQNASAPAQPNSEVRMEKETPPPYNTLEGYPNPSYPNPSYPYPTAQPPQPLPQPQPQPQPSYQPTIVTQPSVTNVTVNTQPQYGGTCPVCHAGKFVTGYTLCGWLCCIFCFPCGILFCCCCMRNKKCNHCGFSVN